MRSVKVFKFILKGFLIKRFTIIGGFMITFRAKKLDLSKNKHFAFFFKIISN